MDGTRRRSWAGLVVALLLTAAACGDDDGGGGEGQVGGRDTEQGTADQGDAVDAGQSSARDVFNQDPCSVLEVSEIEQQFGDLGQVADGEAEGTTCNWEVGTGPDPGFVAVAAAGMPPDQSVEDFLTADGEFDMELSPVEVAGVDAGDAVFDASSPNTLLFRQGDLLVTVVASFSPDVESLQDKLAALAALIHERFAD